MITIITPPPVDLWLNLINRNGKVYISDKTLDEIDLDYLDLFCRKNYLKMLPANDGVILKLEFN